MASSSNSPIIVLGAPRSGTSLIAGSLHNCGISMGHHFLESDTGNPHGYFEDLDFIHFHQSLLARSADSVKRLFEDSTMREQPFDFEVQAEDIASAQALIEARSAKHDAWGWKDPRTCLFLPFWQQLLPDARYIITYKHPLEMSASLLRMGKNWDLLMDPEMAIRSWTFYMSETLNFIQDIPQERYFIANANALIRDNTAFAKCLQEWQIDKASPSVLAAHIVPELITETQLSLTIQRQFSHHFPAASETFEALQSTSQQAMEWLPAHAHDANMTTAVVSAMGTETALRYLQNQIQPSIAHKNIRANDELKHQVTDLVHFRFDREKRLEHQLYVLKQSQADEAAQLRADLEQVKACHTDATKQQQQLAAAQKQTIDAQAHAIQDLSKRLSQAQQLHEITHNLPLTETAYDLFGRSFPPEACFSGIQKWQLKRATLNQWTELHKKSHLNRVWIIDAFSLLSIHAKPHEDPLQQHWENISQDISKMGHLGSVPAPSVARVYAAIQSQHYQNNPQAPRIRLDLCYTRLAKEFKMPVGKASEWTEQRIQSLAEKLQTTAGFDDWLKQLKEKEGRWICSGFHGLSSTSLASLIEKLNLPLLPSDYLCNEAMPSDSATKKYFEHWKEQLKLTNWTKIAWLGSSTVRDYAWPKQSGIQNCYVIETPTDSLPDSSTDR